MRNLFLLSGLFLSLSAAHADSVSVQTFRSPFNLNYGMVESSINDGLPWAEKSSVPKYFLSVDSHYADDPLVVINRTTNTRVSTVVDNVLTTEVAVGYFLNPNSSIYAQLPLHLSALPSRSKEFDLGDSRLAGKFMLGHGYSNTVFSLVPELTLPSGNATRFLSDDSIAPGILLVAENDLGGMRLTGNIGYRYASAARGTGINYRNRIPLGIGASIPVGKKVAVNAEATGSLNFPLAQQQNPSEFYLGLNYHPKKYLALIGGASVGALDSQGSLNYRAQLALRMYLSPEEKAVAEPVYYKEEPKAPAPKGPRARMVENKIEILEEIQFEHNKDRLLQSSKLVLDEVAEIIEKNKADIKRIHVEGHTSLVGSEEYNDKLSVRRCNSVVNYLVNERGIPRKMLVPKGYGEQRPKYLPGKATEEELELNRRVEFNVERNKK